MSLRSRTHSPVSRPRPPNHTVLLAEQREQEWTGGLLAERIRMLITVVLPRNLVISRCFYDITPLNIKKYNNNNNLEWKLTGTRTPPRWWLGVSWARSMAQSCGQHHSFIAKTLTSSLNSRLPCSPASSRTCHVPKGENPQRVCPSHNSPELWCPFPSIFLRVCFDTSLGTMALKSHKSLSKGTKVIE